jgi:hypothetical protein
VVIADLVIGAGVHHCHGITEMVIIAIIMTDTVITDIIITNIIVTDMVVTDMCVHGHR